mgnify:CR=1 FL=1
MKNLPALLLLAALSVFVLFTLLSIEICIPVLFAAGLVAMFFADYARVLRPAGDGAAAGIQRPERFQLAA